MSSPETSIQPAQRALSTPKASPLALMAARFNADPAKLYDTLKATVFKEARNDQELQALVIVANSYGLNPLTKEIYAFPAKGGGIVPVVSIDGWANIANAHPQMDGVNFAWQHEPDGKLVSCTAIIHRKDRTHPIQVTEYLSECRRNTEPWKMEHRMLRHKAFCQAVRIAFGFSGIVDEDEAERDVTPIPQATESKLFTAPVVADVEVVRAPQQTNLLDTPAKSLADQVHTLIESSGVTWGEAVRKMQANGICDEIYTKPNDAPDDVLRVAVDQWPQIVALVKGGSK